MRTKIGLEIPYPVRELKGSSNLLENPFPFLGDGGPNLSSFGRLMS
jgi:hypothetical protein